MKTETLKTNILRRVRLPKGVIPAVEPEAPASQKQLTQIIDRFERGWAAQGRTPREHRESGDCNMAPDIFSFITNDEAQRHGLNAEAKQWQVLDIHEAAGGERSQAFQHGFNTITVDNDPYLVDLTFSQFLGEDGTITYGPRRFKGVSSRVPSTNPLAEQLVRDGFAPLTDENLQQYMAMTTPVADKRYILSATVDTLAAVQPLPMQLGESDGIGHDYGLTP